MEDCINFLESNEKEKFKNFLKAGVNRISIGAQSFNDSHLEKLGRLHKGEDAISAVKAAKSAGFKFSIFVVTVICHFRVRSESLPKFL